MWSTGALYVVSSSKKAYPPVFLLIRSNKFRDSPLLTWIPPMFFAARVGCLFLRGFFFVKTIPPRIFCVSVIVHLLR